MKPLYHQSFCHCQILRAAGRKAMAVSGERRERCFHSYDIARGGLGRLLSDITSPEMY